MVAEGSLNLALPAIGDGSVEQLKVIDELEFRIQVDEIMIKKNLGMRRYLSHGRHVERKAHD